MNKQLTDILHHLRSPYLEIGIMLLSVLLAFCGLVALAVTGPETSGGEMSNVAIIGILLAFFCLLPPSPSSLSSPALVAV